MKMTSIRTIIVAIITVISVRRIAASNPTPPTLEEILQKYQKNYKRLGPEKSRLGSLISGAAHKDECLKIFGGDGGCSEETHTTPESRDMCYAACRTKGWGRDSHIHDLRKHVVDNVNYYCRSVNTVMDRIFMPGSLVGVSMYKKFLSYKVYRYLMGIDNNKYSNSQMIEVIANGLISAIIKHVDTPYSPLGDMYQEIVNTLDEFPTDITYEVEFNTVCDYHTMFDTLDIYTEALMKDTAMEATLLPGYFLASAVSRYLRSKVSFRLKVLMEITRLMTGSVAGFGCQRFGWFLGRKFRREPTTTTPEPCVESNSTSNQSCEDNGTPYVTDDTNAHTHNFSSGLCDELGEEYIWGFPVPPILGDGQHYTAIKGLNC